MKLEHITIQTSHFEEEIAFYEKHAELKMQWDMRPMGRNMVFLADAEGATAIEIIGKPDADVSGNENLSLGFHTPDPEKKREDLLADGCEVGPIISPMQGVKFFFVKDPAGLNVQFI